MTAEITRAVPARGERRMPVAVSAAIVVLVVIRLLQARAGASSDEGGFLLVADQWRAGGTSLYGDYWVDRPPLLIAIFRLADLAGGLTSLRVIGTLACAATVALLAATSLRAFGPRAARWTAVVAAALLVSPLYGAIDVNGELLALPFIALGLRAAVEAAVTDRRRTRLAAALIAGIAAACALLIKQNLADVLVFSTACWFAGWRLGQLRVRTMAALFGVAALGGLSAYVVVSLAASAHGASPADVYDATYPFRVEASKVIADSTSAAADLRLRSLGLAFLLSGVPLLLLLFGSAIRQASSVVWGLIATGLWVTISVVAGGSFWLHYLVESVPVVALTAGAVSVTAPRLLRAAVAFVAVSAVVAAAVVVIRPTPTPGTGIGTAVAAVAEPGDTIVSLFGEPEIVRSSGLASPYAYLWSLPARTLDPELDTLRSVLSGPLAPTWLVIRGGGTEARLVEHGAMAVIDRRYRALGEVCGRPVYVLRGESRSLPAVDRDCAGLR